MTRRRVTFAVVAAVAGLAALVYGLGYVLGLADDEGRA